MTAVMPKEFRLSPRFRITGSGLPGSLVAVTDERELFCVPVDVSCKGLGLLMAEKLAPGDRLELRTAEQSIPLTIVWGKPRSGKLFRYGLKVEDSEADLEEVFFAAGVIEQNL